jgi:hypothetical protein
MITFGIGGSTAIIATPLTNYIINRSDKISQSFSPATSVLKISSFEGSLMMGIRNASFVSGLTIFNPMFANKIKDYAPHTLFAKYNYVFSAGLTSLMCIGPMFIPDLLGARLFSPEYRHWRAKDYLNKITKQHGLKILFVGAGHRVMSGTLELLIFQSMYDYFVKKTKETPPKYTK